MSRKIVIKDNKGNIIVEKELPFEHENFASPKEKQNYERAFDKAMEVV